jgi:glycosyltransferase involved in cell wall biosynthesis
VLEKRISVVLPVYNERDNIAKCLRGLHAALAGEVHEILVCYDFDEDSTLEGMAQMDDLPPTVRLCRNRLGRGAANAIRAGFQAARGDVIVTTMADLCDPPETIPALAAKVREGAAVVSGSRYMKGGSQTGGPWLKQHFSRWAGLSLRWFAGMGTHDPTNNFRAYSRSFLDSVTVDSQTAFDIALELTVKAHLVGAKVAEVPSSWRDRTAGTSRFQMWKWMPNYLRWYWAAMLPPAFVWMVWIGMTIAAHGFLANYASKLPFADDVEMARALGPDAVRDYEWYWSEHNEHRIPLPRALYVTLMDLTRDFRAPMHAEVVVLAGLSALLILAVRRIRGRTSYTDAFFPLLFLQWGNYENLLMGFQISLMLPAALGCAVWAIVATGERVPSIRELLAVGTCILLLPLCGGHGITQVPALTAWIGLAGLASLRSADRDTRRTGYVMTGIAVLSCLMVAFYFYHFTFPENQPHESRPWKVALTTGQFLSLSIGPAARPLWPYSLWFVGLVCASAVWLLFRTFRYRPSERLRSSALLAGFAAILTMGLAAGWGRAADYDELGFAMRYVTLPAPLLCIAYFTWSMYGPAPFGRFLRVLLYSASTALVAYGAARGVEYALIREQQAADLQRDIDSGVSVQEVASRHWQNFYPVEEGFEYRLKLLSQAGLVHFPESAQDEIHAQVADIDQVANPYFMLPVQPIEGHSTNHILPKRIDGRWVVAVQPEGELLFALPEGKHRVRGRYGIHPLAIENPRHEVSDGVRFSIELALDDGTHEVLFEEVLDPAAHVEQRGEHEFEVSLPPRRTGRLALRTSNLPGRNDVMDWSYWSDVEFE